VLLSDNAPLQAPAQAAARPRDVRELRLSPGTKHLDVLRTDEVARLIQQRWALAHPVVHVLGTGLNSATWLVEDGERRFVAKAVPLAENLLAGLTVAEGLSHHGFRSGPPRRALDGSIVVQTAGLHVGLLRWEPGDPVDIRRPEQLEAVGRALARAHRLTRAMPRPQNLPRWPWQSLGDGHHLDLEPWIRPALAHEIREAELATATGEVALGVVHGDPNRTEFLWTGDRDDVALIDWGACSEGPLLYDLASFHVLSHTTEEQLRVMVDAYMQNAEMQSFELANLPRFIRLRWAIQASYFAWRLVNDVSTGGAGREFNDVGLARSRAVLVGDDTT
jgi:Ser/Thr protein kinase RdoA (MazF antagonist)